ncbi:MAG: hypothetical protein RL591_2413, partial [Planctomycetota bacterium]
MTLDARGRFACGATRLLPTVGLLLPVSLSVSLSLAHLTGCASTPSEGYAAVSPYPSKYRSVAVPIFRNQSYMRGFELDLA